LWAIFEPRSNTSRRNIHQEEYARAFTGAQRASLKTPERHDKVPTGEELDVPRLVSELRGQGIDAGSSLSVDEMVSDVAKRAEAGDVLLVMSNGAFGGFLEKLLSALKKAKGEG
jgi:UDP-N-acetylmuramate: L-alanyl-gamma-D-glutamyl-meso-diaminopimelate ligase